MPAVFVLVGAPGSGKSTQAKQLQKSFGGIILCPDDVRLEKQFARQEDYARYCLSFGHYVLRRGRHVIYDATNAHPEFRKEWIELSRTYEAESYAIWMDTPIGVCFRRHQARPHDAAHAGLSVLAIERYCHLIRRNKPSTREGFTAVQRVTPDGVWHSADLLPTPQHC